MGIEAEVPVGDGRMRCINEGVAGTVMLMASSRRLDVGQSRAREWPSGCEVTERRGTNSFSA